MTDSITPPPQPRAAARKRDMEPPRIQSQDNVVCVASTLYIKAWRVASGSRVSRHSKSAIGPDHEEERRLRWAKARHKSPDYDR